MHQETNSAQGQDIQTYLDTLRFLNESTDDYLYLTDFQTDRIYFSGPIYEKYNLNLLEKEYCSQKDWKDIIYDRDLPAFQENMAQIQSGTLLIHNMEYRLLDRQGNKIWISSRGKCQLDASGKPRLMIGRVSDMALARKVDLLTGLCNSTKLSEDMEGCLKERSVGYLLLFGVDNLKNINIKYGREFGNGILKMVAEVLERIVDPSLRIYRMDGDRFGVNLVGMDANGVIQLFERVRKEMANSCTMSAGAVSYGEKEEESSWRLYQYAESALDRAKTSGKNQLAFFSAHDFEKSLSMIDLQEEMRQSIQNNFGGFSLCYQPQMDGQTYQLLGAEALLRYQSPSRGMVDPTEFIPILEQSELICPVGKWAMETALCQCKRWREEIPHFHISVNLSYVQLKKEDFPQTVLQILDQIGLPGEALTLEVTESIQLQDYQWLNQIFCDWKKRGIRISVDDFGTGYSSLSHLKSIAIDEVKIDRCFVSGIQYSAYHCRLLHNIIELAHSAQIRICCEGVETEKELAVLKRMRPDVLQGFLFAKPFEKTQFEEVYMQENTSAYQERMVRHSSFQELEAEENQKAQTTDQEENFQAILEGMEDIVYVSDLDTYELYYLNSAGRRITGVQDYQGCKCYEILQGKDAPCEFCTNALLEKNGFHIWSFRNLFLKHHFILKDKLIHWNQKPARMEVAINMTEKEIISQYIKDKLDRQLSATECSDSPQSKTIPLCFSERMERSEKGVQPKLPMDGRSLDILKAVQLGLWTIRIDKQNGVCELFVDSTLCEILGFPNDRTPEECYHNWYNRINADYYDCVNFALDDMIHSKRLVQLEYTWHHPCEGEVTVQQFGIRVDDSDGMICLDGYLRLISGKDKIQFFPDTYHREIFEYHEGKKSIYFYTERKLLAGEEKEEYDFPECWIQSGMVHPHFVETFRAVFVQTRTNPERNGLELFLKTKSGSYEFFKIKTRRLGQEKPEANTVVVFLEPASQQRALELEYNRIYDFYHAILSETIAYVEVDLESGQLKAAGGLWESYRAEWEEGKECFCEPAFRSLDEVMIPEEREFLQSYLHMNLGKETLPGREHTQKCCFRRKIGEETRWVEMVLHTFQDHITGNMYALLYLRDIDVEKKRELAQEMAASRDPLTNVYNRRFFEREVLHYMTEEKNSHYGAMVVLDLDNFKRINDQFGHLKGDQALVRFSQILENVFSEKDLIGRLGGDEFLVFLKGVRHRNVLNRQLEQLFDALQDGEPFSLSCSVGIVFTQAKTFDYQTSVRQADIALYESKKRGKGQYFYFEDL